MSLCSLQAALSAALAPEKLSTPTILNLRHLIVQDDSGSSVQEKLEAAIAFLATISKRKRAHIDILDLSCNHIADEHLPLVASMAQLLPHLSELDLSACLLHSAHTRDIQQLTHIPSLKRLYILQTMIASFSGRAMFEGLCEEDVGKIVFMSDVSFVQSKVWANMIPAHLCACVARVHQQFFDENLDDLIPVPNP